MKLKLQSWHVMCLSLHEIYIRFVLFWVEFEISEDTRNYDSTFL